MVVGCVLVKQVGRMWRFLKNIFFCRIAPNRIPIRLDDVIPATACVTKTKTTIANRNDERCSNISQTTIRIYLLFAPLYQINWIVQYVILYFSINFIMSSSSSTSSSSSSNRSIHQLIREKLSKEEAVQLVELLDREVPKSRYMKFINAKTGEEVDYDTYLQLQQQQQPKPSSCYEHFLDYMNCHVRVFFGCLSSDIISYLSFL